MLKKLLHSVREYKLATILSPFLMIGEVAMEVTIPTVMEKLVDNGITPGNMTVVWQQGLLLALCALCSLAFGVGRAGQLRRHRLLPESAPRYVPSGADL